MNENLTYAVHQGPPTVYARLSRFGQLLVNCPYCGLVHTHGIKGGAGHRAADCPPGTLGMQYGYFLVVGESIEQGVKNVR